MPQDGLFFRVLRRFNMILATVVGLAILVLGGLFAWSYITMFLPIHEHARVGFITEPRAGVPAKAEDFVIEPEAYGTPDTYYGPHTNEILVLKHAMPFPTPDSLESYASYVPQQAVNLLVLDRAGEGHWLFPTNKQVIVMRDALYEGPPLTNSVAVTDTRPVLGMVLIVAETDTNKDGKLSNLDRATLYVWIKGETAPEKLLSMDEMISVGQEDERYVVVYKNGKELKSAVFSVPEFKLLSEKILPEAPK